LHMIYKADFCNKETISKENKPIIKENEQKINNILLKENSLKDPLVRDLAITYSIFLYAIVKSKVSFKENLYFIAKNINPLEERIKKDKLLHKLEENLAIDDSKGISDLKEETDKRKARVRSLKKPLDKNPTCIVSTLLIISKEKNSMIKMKNAITEAYNAYRLYHKDSPPFGGMSGGKAGKNRASTFEKSAKSASHLTELFSLLRDHLQESSYRYGLFTHKVGKGKHSYQTYLLNGLRDELNNIPELQAILYKPPSCDNDQWKKELLDGLSTHLEKLEKEEESFILQRGVW